MTTRRDFLKGLKSSTGDAVPGQETLLRVGRPAMACQFEVCLNLGQYDEGTDAALAALDLVDRLEEQLSVFRPESEICRINRTAASRPVEVELRLFRLLEMCLRLSEATGGAWDMTSTPLWEVWGFSRRAGTIPAAEQLAEARDRVGSHLVELDPDRRTVRFRKSGVQLSLGSVGKGYALDRCAEHLRVAGVRDFLLHGGQSSVLAQGSRRSKTGAGRGWDVGIAHPVRSRGPLGQVQLADRALATSSAQFQSFRHQGRRFGHILDPRTGWPAEGLVSVTVAAPTAALADALSTAFYVMGAEAALEYCRTRPELAVLLVRPAPHGSGVEVQAAGFDDECRLELAS